MHTLMYHDVRIKNTVTHERGLATSFFPKVWNFGVSCATNLYFHPRSCIQ